MREKLPVYSRKRQYCDGKLSLQIRQESQNGKIRPEDHQIDCSGRSTLLNRSDGPHLNPSAILFLGNWGLVTQPRIEDSLLGMSMDQFSGIRSRGKGGCFQQTTVKKSCLPRATGVANGNARSEGPNRRCRPNRGASLRQVQRRPAEIDAP